MTVFCFQWGHKKRWRGEEIDIKWADAAPRSPPTSEVEETWEKTEAKNGRSPESTVLTQHEVQNSQPSLS